MDVVLFDPTGYEVEIILQGLHFPCQELQACVQITGAGHGGLLSPPGAGLRVSQLAVVWHP